MSEVPKQSVGGLPLERDAVEGEVNVDDASRSRYCRKRRPVRFQAFFS